MKRPVRILRDVVAFVLVSAVAFVPITAVHSCAEPAAAQQHPLFATSSNASKGAAEVATDGATSESDDVANATGQPDSAANNVSAATTPEAISVEALFPSGQLPRSFSLTNGDLATSVKLQNPWGACWAFAIASAVESSILEAEARTDGTFAERIQAGVNVAPKLSGLTEQVDVSERAIAWLSHELQTEDSAGAQAGEGLYRVDTNDPTTQLAGGNFSIVEAALAARQGLVSEAAAPYQYNGYAPGSAPWFTTGTDGADARAFDWSIDDSLRTANDLGWYVSGILELPSPAVSEYDSQTGTYRYVGYDADATRQVKSAIVTTGAVAISLEAETSLPGQARQSDHFDYGSWAQYDAADTVFTNHAVSIVGWDDTYSKSNFGGTASGQPAADGAWLCKNNWGSDALYAALGGSAQATQWGLDSDAGASGLFWLSYYDHTITLPVAFEVTRLDNSHDTLYQHDYLGMSEYSEPASYEGAVLVGNMFTAQSTELVRAVTAQTFRQNEQVECWVYLMPAEGDDGWEAAYATETFSTAGFHTLTLDAPVLVGEGQRFMVVQRVHANVQLDGRDRDASYLNLELAFAEPPNDGQLVETMATVKSNPGETYVALSDDPSQWMNLEDFNVWYQDVRAQAGGANVTYGNALVKAMTDTTSMASEDRVYELVPLSGSS